MRYKVLKSEGGGGLGVSDEGVTDLISRLLSCSLNGVLIGCAV